MDVWREQLVPTAAGWLGSIHGVVRQLGLRPTSTIRTPGIARLEPEQAAIRAIRGVRSGCGVGG